MINRLQVWTIVIIALVAAVIADWLFTGTWQWTVLLRVGAAAGAVVLSIMVFDNWLWKWKRLQGWYVHRPHIGGTWKVRITPLKPDPTTGKVRPRRTYEYDIQQTYTKLHVRMTNGPESEGETLAASIKHHDDGKYELVLAYLNTPKQSVRPRSEIHRGLAMLRILGDPNEPTALEGSYWTDRQAHGEIRATRPLP